MLKWEWFDKHRFFDGGDFYNVGGKVWTYGQCWHMTVMDPAGVRLVFLRFVRKLSHIGKAAGFLLCQYDCSN